MHKHQVIKAWRGSGSNRHALLASATDGYEWSLSRCGHLTFKAKRKAGCWRQRRQMCAYRGSKLDGPRPWPVILPTCPECLNRREDFVSLDRERVPLWPSSGIQSSRSHVFCTSCDAQRGADLRYTGAPLYNAGHLNK